jgi:hypothetical protein
MVRIPHIAAGFVIAVLLLAATACGTTSVQSAQTTGSSISQRHASSQDATNAWNSLCAARGFPAIESTTPAGWTFEDAWNSVGNHGSHTFSADLNSMLTGVASLMSTTVPTIEPDDTFKVNIVNWPDS